MDMGTGRKVRMLSKAPVVIVGAGPAGLSAAIEAGKAGARVMVLDNNKEPGGQLFKQIHKFFGSQEHKAGMRGFKIGQQLLAEAKELGIELLLDTEVCGLGRDKKLWAIQEKAKVLEVQASKVILATGASERPVSFPGWTLPGVMGAGAAQTMVNVHRVLPGKKILMLGSGNVGVIVAYQLLQAGAEVCAVVEGASRLSAYGVHTAKLRRVGIPFYTNHTVREAMGEKVLEAVEISALDSHWKPIKGTEKIWEVDTLCIATGLTPVSELAWAAGCCFQYVHLLGGHIPIHNRNMETSVEGIYVAGDLTGIEEASTAIEEGRLAGIAVAASLGYYTSKEAQELITEGWERLDALRQGPYGEKRKRAKDLLLGMGGTD